MLIEDIGVSSGVLAARPNAHPNSFEVYTTVLLSADTVFLQETPRIYMSCITKILYSIKIDLQKQGEGG